MTFFKEVRKFATMDSSIQFVDKHRDGISLGIKMQLKLNALELTQHGHLCL